MIARTSLFIRCGICVSAMLLGGALAALPANAQDEGPWPVHGKIVGKKDRKSTDVSGIACTRDEGFPRVCLVIDDEVQSAQLVTVEDGTLEAGATIRLIDDEHDGKALELDGEGVAYADGFFYVIGSHGHPRDKDHKLDTATIAARTAATSQIVRIHVDPQTGRPMPNDAGAVTRSARLKALVAAQHKLAPFIDRPLDENGVTIEGLAIRGDRLFVGFRGPSFTDRAAVLETSLAAEFDGGDGDANAKLHLLPLGDDRGVRDLVVFGSGMLVLAGPTADDGSGSYAIYWWDGRSDDVKQLGNLAKIDDEDGQPVKPEAILPLDHTAAKLRVLILSDGAKEGGPQAVRIKMP